MTCLPAASDEIHALTSTHGVFYWTFTVPELEEDLENEDFNVENYGEKFEIEEANKAKEEYVEKTSRPTGVWLWEGSDGWMEHSPTDSARIDEAAGDACPVEVFIENERLVGVDGGVLRCSWFFITYTTKNILQFLYMCVCACVCVCLSVCMSFYPTRFSQLFGTG